jgi:hypothetical protein
MVYGFYSKQDETKETIGRTVDVSRLGAAKYFASRKHLSLKQFLQIFGVKQII